MFVVVIYKYRVLGNILHWLPTYSFTVLNQECMLKFSIP